ncbi:MAG: T9SS type A sorting domain-containing protein, partial [Chitinophagaceae bacterium]|nr:T9SS type A sorting domain-containing protein [Chitinophagaceae bacterium]
KGRGLYSFILMADSNGQVYRYKDLPYNDSVNQLSGIAYDGGQYIIAAGKHITDTASNLLFYKFDTALNMLWLKSYHPRVLLIDQITQNLVVDSSGYMLCGGGQNSGFSWEKSNRVQALLFKTDTAGRELWTWTSPFTTYSEYKGFIGAAVRTQDGGYLFTTMGRTYNSLSPSDPIVRLKAKQMIIKLDADRKPLWETVIDDYFTEYGYIPASLLELADGSFIFLGGRVVDSVAAPVYIEMRFVLQRYSPSGILLDQHKLNPYLPRVADDTHPESGGPVNHIIQLPDKGFLLAGWYENRTAGAPTPRQRGWLLKLDSNGCLGPADTQCRPTAIRDPQQTANQFSVYPNPSNGSFTITSPNVSLNLPAGQAGVTKWREGFLSVAIYDLTGRSIHQQAAVWRNNTATINVQTAAGVYILELSSETGERYRQKIVIE